MPSVRPCLDPYYRGEVAQWVQRRISGMGLRVDVVEDLQVPGYSSRGEGYIWLRPGLAFPEFHWMLAKAAVHQLFGVEPTADMPTGSDIKQVAGDAKVIPFQRHLPVSSRRR